MREKVNRKQNAAFKALWSKSSSRVTNVNCHMGSVPIGGQPSVHNDHDGQKSPISDKIEPITKASDNLCLLNWQSDSRLFANPSAAKNIHTYRGKNRDSLWSWT